MVARIIPNSKPTFLPLDYPDLLLNLKSRINRAQVRARLSVNHELIMLYWEIGTELLAQKRDQKWGGKVFRKLSRDLQTEFPGMRGLSKSNLNSMCRFASAWPRISLVQQLVGQIPWGHNIRLLEKVADHEERQWYVRATIEHGWSRAVMVAQIESSLFHRHGKAVTNFERTMPAAQTDLLRDIIKDPYNLEFLELDVGIKERELHRKLIDHMQEFLLELGAGFAFVGSEFPLEVGGQDFYLDLLFYHLKLECFIVVELKTARFKPEHSGKLNFYLSAVDDLLRRAHDRPSIGLLLCQNKNRVVAEYALRDVNKPMGISEIQLTSHLPDELRKDLPSSEEMEAEFDLE